VDRCGAKTHGAGDAGHRIAVINSR
jgi:hypothetical protein